MRKLMTAVLLVALASSLYAGEKAPKFESIAGSYSGPTESYGLVLERAADGTLRGNYVEMGRVAVLNAIVLNGAEFTARASFDDGSSRTITGSLTNRGIRLHAVPVEGLGAIDTFFERL